MRLLFPSNIDVICGLPLLHSLASKSSFFHMLGFPAPIRWRSDENVLSGSYNNKQRINGSSNGINGSESDNEGINNNNNKHDHGATIGMWRNKKQKWVKISFHIEYCVIVATFIFLCCQKLFQKIFSNSKKIV
jgi:hypothetical protein